MQQVIVEARRRRWSEADKQRIVLESFAAAESVSGVARRYGLHGSQLFAWRRAYREVMAGETVGERGAGFLSVEVKDAFGDAAADAAGRVDRPGLLSAADRDDRAGVIEIELGCGTRLRLGGDVDEQALSRVLRALRAAR